MQTKKLIIVLALCLSILPLAACDEAKKIKRYAADAINLCELGQTLLERPDIRNALPANVVARAETLLATTIKPTAQKILEIATKNTELDKTSKAEIASLFGDIVKGLRELNDLNLVNIQNEPLRLQISSALSGLETLIKFAQNRLQP